MFKITSGAISHHNATINIYIEIHAQRSLVQKPSQITFFQCQLSAAAGTCTWTGGSSIGPMRLPASNAEPCP